MTHDEFRQQYEAWHDTFDQGPYSPLAVILMTGDRVYIDMPEQVTLAEDELVITRRKNPRKPERYRYSDIAQLIPLSELPADSGGVSYAEFDPLMRELLMADPFQPFVIELTNGERLEINKRSEIGRAGRHLTLFGEPPQSFTHYTFNQVARLVQKPRAVPA
jgi:hypothetical protein